MSDTSSVRVAWIYPSIAFGAYWLPILNEFVKTFSNTIFYTGCLWPGFDPTAPGADVFKVIGKTDFVETNRATDGYTRGFIYASPAIIWYLLRFRPHLVFASAFSIWTVLALLFKPLGGWRVAIIYDGSSPNTAFQDSKLRSHVRKIMARFTDAFVANSRAAANYLIQDLQVNPNKVFTQTYLVPDSRTLLQQVETLNPAEFDWQAPVFLFVGQIIPRKGIKVLLEACSFLKQQGYETYTLVIVGDGAQRAELEARTKELGLERQIVWTGWVDYASLGAYFQRADIFVFPSLEDVWGMVVLEAMAFGKPVLCSKGANALELVENGENGYLFDPHDTLELAKMMQLLIDKPEHAVEMGRKSQQLMTEHTPEATAKRLTEIISTILNRKFVGMVQLPLTNIAGSNK